MRPRELKGDTEAPDGSALPTGIDAYAPIEIARRIDQAGVAKSRLTMSQLLTLSILAGMFISLGGVFYTSTISGFETLTGPVRVLGGAAFSLGLILVIVGGAELFTGNALMVMALVEGRIRSSALLRNWSIVYLGNAAGALLIVGLMAASGLLAGATGRTAASISSAKVALGPVEAFARGVLCNALVCLAVWLSFAARTVEGKILAIVWPITAFVAIGFEHSIANMYLIPAGWFGGAAVDPAGFAANLIFVTLGNVVGGAGGVALAYWFAYRPRRETT